MLLLLHSDELEKTAGERSARNNLLWKPKKKKKKIRRKQTWDGRVWAQRKAARKRSGCSKVEADGQTRRDRCVRRAISRRSKYPGRHLKTLAAFLISHLQPRLLRRPWLQGWLHLRARSNDLCCDLSVNCTLNSSSVFFFFFARLIVYFMHTGWVLRCALYWNPLIVCINCTAEKASVLAAYRENRAISAKKGKQ